MRRTPPQHKGDGKTGSTRVTLRLHQLKLRDEKRRNASVNSVVTCFTSVMDGKAKSDEAASETKPKEEPVPVLPEAEKAPVEKAVDDSNMPPEPEPASDTAVASGKKTPPVQPPSGVKRSAGELTDAAEEGEDESKKKKRRDSDAAKDSARNTVVGRPPVGKNTANTVDKATKPTIGLKPTTGVTTTAKAASSSNPVDRKSPTGSLNPVSSPKPVNSKPGEPEEENEEMPLVKTCGAESGPKVPPLKIVIPQQTATLEQEQGSNRNGKNGKPHQALPYVVASSNSSNDSVSDKDVALNAGSANPSPTECGTGVKVGEDKKDPLSNLTAEERSTHQRVLRSSNRSGGSSCSSSSGGQPAGGSGVNPSTSNNAGSNASSPQPGSSNNSVGDRNSNNSSPHQSTSRCQSPVLDVAPPVPAEPQPVATTPKVANVCVTPPAIEIKCEPVEAPPQPPPAPTQVPSVELHPRKRKLKQSKESQAMHSQAASTSTSEPVDTSSDKPEIHPHEQPTTNCYQLFLDIRKQIERRRKGLFPVQPKPPSGFKDYLMNRCTYVLAGNSSSRLSIPSVTPPQTLHGTMKELFTEQEKERYRLRMQHVIEKEKLVLSVEQEILRVHGRAARALANQSLPFSVCTILKDEEVYNVITPEEEMRRNARSRYNGRLFISWLQDVDDKWEKIKESMLLRHHNEAESLHAVQKMDWEWKMKELGICEFKVKPVIEDLHVPMVHVSDDFDLLPA